MGAPIGRCPSSCPARVRASCSWTRLTAAPQLTQAACYQLILDRKLGEYELPAGWTIIAAGNRESDRGVVHRMPSPLTNRFVHLDFGVDLDDWTKWATKHGIATEVIAFLRFRDELLHDFDPKRSDKAFPTPRSWEFVSNIVGSGTVTNGIEYPLIAGAVGEGAAAEFMGFLRIARSIQGPDMILMNPEKSDIPEEAATLYVISTALARKATEGNTDRVVAYANRLPDEFSVLLVKDALDRDPAVANTRAYIEWVSEHHEVIMSNLTEKAMLVRQAINVWSGRKFDKKVTREVLDHHNASTDAGRWNKSLIARAALADVTRARAANQARTHHYDHTLSWEDWGARILPAAAYFDYMDEQRDFKTEFDAAADAFERNYVQYVNDAKAALNGMFDPNDYPGVHEIRSRLAGHGAGASLLHRQTGLSAVERLDL